MMITKIIKMTVMLIMVIVAFFLRLHGIRQTFCSGFSGVLLESWLHHRSKIAFLLLSYIYALFFTAAIPSYKFY